MSISSFQLQLFVFLPIYLLFSYRKTLLLATGIIVAGGTAAAYMQSRNSCKRPTESFGHCNGLLSDDNEQSDKVVGTNNNIVKKSRQKKKGGLRSLQVLAAILLSHMGRMGAGDLLALVATVVSPLNLTASEIQCLDVFHSFFLVVFCL